MSKLARVGAAALACLAFASCSDRERHGVHGDDGFAVGTVALSLSEAPPGLCEGGGSDKECGPEGCAEQPETAGVGGAGQSFGTGGQPRSGAAPLPASQPSQSGAAGSGFDQAPPSAEPMESASDPSQVPPPSSGARDAGSQDAGAAECSDAGVLPDGGSCDDAGVAQAQAALITDDVPGCLSIDPAVASTLYLSADDSNSMAGPVIARHLIEQGRSVPAFVVRPWEFLNYYDFAFEPAPPGEVRIVPQLSSCPQNDRLSLQVALQAEARPADQRQPLTLTFVLDTSGSMTGTPISLERQAVLTIAGQLRAGDVVSMVTWDTAQAEILSGHEISGPNDPVLVAAAQALSASGGTDLHAGLVSGYALAEQHRGVDRVNRVILISDGQANVGITDEELIGRYADDEEGDAGIYLAGIGVGDGVNDTLMNVVTDAGRGAYIYLDSAQEAQRMLGERFLQVVDVAARAVRLEVTLPYYLVLEKFFGEVASTDAAKVRPQHMAPNDAMLFFQVLRACDPALLHGDDRIKIRATWETPFTREAREAVVDTTLNGLSGDDADLTKAAAIASYAEALIAADTLTDAAQRAQALRGALSNVKNAKNADSDPDLLEVARLLERYIARIAPQPTPVTTPTGSGI